MTKPLAKFSGDAARLAALEMLQARGPMTVPDLAQAMGKKVDSVRGWMDRFEEIHAVAINVQVRPFQFAAAFDWRDRLHQYLVERDAKFRERGIELQARTAGQQKGQSAPPARKINAKMLAACMNIRPDVRTTWRMPEAERAAA